MTLSSLVDSGCTATAFFDDVVVMYLGLERTTLISPRSLCLADGVQKPSITHKVQLLIKLGAHAKVINCLLSSDEAQQEDSAYPGTSTQGPARALLNGIFILTIHNSSGLYKTLFYSDGIIV